MRAAIAFDQIDKAQSLRQRLNHGIRRKFLILFNFHS